ncbi:MAG: serine hydrolase domain-containing protein [Saprospiraceae bacterium]
MKKIENASNMTSSKNLKSRYIRWILIGLSILIIVFFAYIIPRLPIITGYVAKEVCSCTFVAKRDIERTKKEDVGYFPVNLASFSVDYESKTVKSHILGLSSETAVYRPNLGCTLVHNIEVDEVQRQSFDLPVSVIDKNLPFPNGDYVVDTFPSRVEEDKLQKAMDFAMNCKGTRAAMVVYKGQIIGERYAEGFDKDSRHLAWSISKSVTNALYGILVKKDIIKTKEPANIASWKDERKEITIDDLLQMNSGLEWEENYFDLSGATLMLFKNDDFGAFAAESTLEFKPAEHWEYSSGTSNILAEIMQERIDNQSTYWSFPYTELFNKIGIQSMILEADASGTYVGSSYSWATVRDWARLGQLYLNNGLWNGEQIFPSNWVNYSTTPAEGSNGIYGAQIWLNTTGKYKEGCPKDLYNFGGFNGQNVSMIPSKDLVILRFGLNSIEPLDYAAFVRQVVDAVSIEESN